MCVRHALEASRSWTDAGGSDFTYQITGNAGLDINERYALVFGYRYINVNSGGTVAGGTALRHPIPTR